MDDIRYDFYSLIGLILTVAMITVLAIITITQPGKMQAAANKIAAESIDRGGEIYTEACAECHGEEGEGDGKQTPPLNKKEFLAEATDEIIFNVINDGRPGTSMPAWGQSQGGPYNDQAIEELTAFIRAWEADAPSLDNLPYIPDLTRGRILFSNTCFACHGIYGEGTSAGPTINSPDFLAQFDDDYLRKIIQRGRASRGMPTWGTVLSPDQIEDVVAYIRGWESSPPTESSLPGGDTARGQTLFEIGCVSCHGIKGFGTNLAPLALGRLDFMETATDRELSDIITYGSNTMPGWAAALSPAEVGDIVAYIRLLPVPGVDDVISDTSKASPNVPTSAGDPEAGQELYVDECAFCHGIEANGKKRNPPLRQSEDIQAMSDDDLSGIILFGVPTTRMSGFADDLTVSQIDDLIAFIRTIQ